jgi:hypothetical protein
MNKTMFAAILSVGLLLFGAIAVAYENMPNAAALMKSKGTYLKSTNNPTRPHDTKICGDKLCTTLKDASFALKKGQTNRNVP